MRKLDAEFRQANGIAVTVPVAEIVVEYRRALSANGGEMEELTYGDERRERFTIDKAGKRTPLP